MQINHNSLDNQKILMASITRTRHSDQLFRIFNTTETPFNNLHRVAFLNKLASHKYKIGESNDTVNSIATSLLNAPNLKIGQRCQVISSSAKIGINSEDFYQQITRPLINALHNDEEISPQELSMALYGLTLIAKENKINVSHVVNAVTSYLNRNQETFSNYSTQAVAKIVAAYKTLRPRGIGREDSYILKRLLKQNPFSKFERREIGMMLPALTQFSDQDYSWKNMLLALSHVNKELQTKEVPLKDLTLGLSTRATAEAAQNRDDPDLISSLEAVIKDKNVPFHRFDLLNIGMSLARLNYTNQEVSSQLFDRLKNHQSYHKLTAEQLCEVAFAKSILLPEEDLSSFIDEILAKNEPLSDIAKSQLNQAAIVNGKFLPDIQHEPVDPSAIQLEITANLENQLGKEWNLSIEEPIGPYVADMILTNEETGEMVIVEINGPAHYLRHSGRENGVTALKKRCLENMNFPVISVNLKDFQNAAKEAIPFILERL